MDQRPLTMVSARVDPALTPSSLFAFNLSQHQDLFQRVGSSYQVIKYWNFSFSISPSSEYRIDFL